MKEARFFTGLFILVFLVAEGFSQRFSFQREINPFPVRSGDGSLLKLPALGGLNSPTPQFVDIDLDGDFDLFVQEEFTDALIFFENVGEPDSPKFSWRTDQWLGMNTGFWYRFTDVDNDGDPDLFTDGEGRGAMRFRRNDATTGAPVFVIVTDSLADVDGAGIEAEAQSVLDFGDVNCDGLKDLFIGKQSGEIKFYENTGIGVDGAPQFKLISERYQDLLITNAAAPKTVLNAVGAHGANAIQLVDFDRDNDMDLFWGDFFSQSLYFVENSGTCEAPEFAIASTFFPLEDTLITGGFNVPQFVDIDADGDVDLFSGVGVGLRFSINSFVENLYFFENTGAATSPRFVRKTSQFLEAFDIGDNSVPALVDIDGDQDLDLFLANNVDVGNEGESGRIYFLENEGSAQSPSFVLRSRNFFEVEVGFGAAPTFVDIDADGDPDLFAGNVSGKTLFFENTGSPTTPLFVGSGELPEDWGKIRDVGTNSAPTFADIDNDGDFDLFIGELRGNVNFYRNDGMPQAPAFVEITENLAEIDVGEHSFPHFADIDDDDDLDLILGQKNDVIHLFENIGAPTSFEFAAGTILPIQTMNRPTPVLGDLDGDGDLDLLSGGIRGGFMFFRNERIASNLEEIPNQPSSLALLRNYPNPFNPTTTIEYEFSKNDLNVTARISIFNINGRLLQRKALAAKKGVNRGKFIWDAGKRSSGSGVFFAVLETGETRVVRKMVLLH